MKKILNLQKKTFMSNTINKFLLGYIFVFYTFLFHFQITAQNSEQVCKEIHQIMYLLEEGHYKPVEINDSFSEKLFRDFVIKLDKEAIYFTNVSLKELYKHQKQLDDYIQDENCEFLKEFVEFHKKRLENTEKIINKLATKKLDFTSQDSLTFFDADRLEDIFSNNELDLEKRWEKSLKFEVLSLLYQEEGIISEDWSLESVQKKEEEIRKKVVEKEKCKIQKILKTPYGYENYIKSLFINALTNLFDPHTSYFTKEQLKSFTSLLSKENMGLGVQLSENDQDEIIITQLLPGGAAWKSNNLHKNDVILKIKIDDKTLDMSCIGATDVGQFIKTSSGKKVELRIRKSSGEIKEVTLYKEKLENEENIVQGFILKGNKNVGYIALPGFYTQEGEKDAKGCANDVAKEILKLKKENIEGLILDLRHNGGGSVQEAIDLAGIFIEEGTVSIDRMRIERPILLKDRNRGTIYDEPLIILVNQNSASASEIFASALQDYNRALIVGSPTFGKSTGQVILPIDENLEFGFIKMTVSKFYRVDGTTHQQQGIQPDVALPDVLSVLGYREIDYKTSLVKDTILKKVYYRALEEISIRELNQKSKERTLKDNNFQRILEFIQSWGSKKEKTVELNPQKFKNYMDKQFNLYQKIAEFSYKNVEVYQALNNQYDREILEMNPHKKLLNDVAIESIQSDIYIEESYKIMCDFIDLQK